MKTAGNAAFDPRHSGGLSRLAMTLLEVMLGVAILTITSFSILSGLIQGLRIAEQNLREETALVVAQRYLEGLKATSLEDLKAPGTWNINGMTPGETEVRHVDLRSTPDTTTDDLRLELTPDVRLTAAATAAFNKVSAYEILLKYTWRMEGETDDKEKTRTLRVVRAICPNL